MASVRADALALCSDWATQNASESSSRVLEAYLRPAVKEASERRKALLALGEYVADMHASLVTRSKTPEWRQARKVASERKTRTRKTGAVVRRRRQCREEDASRWAIICH